MKIGRLLLYIAFAIVIILPYIGFFYLKGWYQGELDKINNAKFILIDKGTMKLSLYDYKGECLDTFSVACGKNYGNKRCQGDMRTPEGVFHISDIQDASTWTHDFKDGNGEIDGAYGPWFLRLACGDHKGIGIHGTHKPESIGTRATEGCIRLENSNVDKLKHRVNPGMVVVICPSVRDVIADQDSLLFSELKKQ